MMEAVVALLLSDFPDPQVPSGRAQLIRALAEIMIPVGLIFMGWLAYRAVVTKGGSSTDQGAPASDTDAQKAVQNAGQRPTPSGDQPADPTPPYKGFDADDFADPDLKKKKQ